MVGINSVQDGGNAALETSEDLLNKLLNESGIISISEFRTIILMKLIRPDGYYTWLVKHPRESMLCKLCTRCKCSSAYRLNDESLWINPTGSPVQKIALHI